MNDLSKFFKLSFGVMLLWAFPALLIILGCFWGELMPGLLIGLGIGLFLYYYREDR